MPWVISKTPSFNVGKLHFSITVKRATGCSDVYFGLTFGKFKNVLLWRRKVLNGLSNEKQATLAA